MPGWKFVTNYTLVPCQIAQQLRITIRGISLTLRITKKAIHSIIIYLDVEGYVNKKKYQLNRDLCLREDML